MAGRDQSVNLGGMLTDIGKTVGGMADAYTPVLDAAMRPRGDMNDPNFLQQMAEYERRRGNTAAAGQYMSQARQITAETQAKQKAAVDQAQVGMVNAYAKAMMDPGNLMHPDVMPVGPEYAE